MRALRGRCGRCHSLSWLSPTSLPVFCLCSSFSVSFSCLESSCFAGPQTGPPRSLARRAYVAFVSLICIVVSWSLSPPLRLHSSMRPALRRVAFADAHSISHARTLLHPPRHPSTDACVFVFADMCVLYLLECGRLHDVVYVVSHFKFTFLSILCSVSLPFHASPHPPAPRLFDARYQRGGQHTERYLSPSSSLSSLRSTSPAGLCRLLVLSSSLVLSVITVPPAHDHTPHYHVVSPRYAASHSAPRRAQPASALRAAVAQMPRSAVAHCRDAMLAVLSRSAYGDQCLSKSIHTLMCFS